MVHRPHRRDLLKLSLAAGAGFALPSPLSTAAAQPGQQPVSPATRVLRLVHLTDAHVQPEHGGAEGLTACLRHIREHAKPDLIIAGGDQIMDAAEHEEARVAALFALWKQVVADEAGGLPIRYVIGNHDIWGWHRGKAKTTGDEPRYGKAWPLEAFGLAKPYYAFEQAGWKFFVLDSVQDDGGEAYVAKLEDEQFAWFEAELKATPAAMPVIVFSHVPIAAFCPLLFGTTDTDKGLYPRSRWNISQALLHLDARRLKDLFRQHPNVKLAVSGHIHLQDRVDYLGVTYLCNPAVSAGWWRGPMQEFDNAYTTIDLFADGTFSYEVVPFGWTAR